MKESKIEFIKHEAFAWEEYGTELEEHIGQSPLYKRLYRTHIAYSDKTR